MLLSIFRNYCFWAYGGTVDTLVLGTSLARGESSNLSKPTSKCLPLVKLADKLRSCVSCCDLRNMLRNELKRVQYYKDFVYAEDLGMKALISTHSLLHILLQQQRFFLILTHYAPVHQFRNYAQHIFRNSALVHTIVSKCSPPEFSEYMSVHQS